MYSWPYSEPRSTIEVFYSVLITLLGMEFQSRFFVRTRIFDPKWHGPLSVRRWLIRVIRFPAKLYCPRWTRKCSYQYHWQCYWGCRLVSKLGQYDKQQISRPNSHVRVGYIDGWWFIMMQRSVWLSIKCHWGLCLPLLSIAHTQWRSVFMEWLKS